MFCEDEKYVEEQAVSPVIAVILMVAITVILATTIGAFVLGFSGDTYSPPRSTLTVELNPSSEKINLTHDGGDGINLVQTRIVITEGGDTDIITSSSNVDFTVGNKAIIDVDDNTVDWGGDGNTEVVDYDSEIGGLSTGDRVNIKLIDTQTNTVFFNSQKTV